MDLSSKDKTEYRVIITFLYLQRELKVAKVEVSLWKVMELES
jgi:hypothetical protein